LTFPCSMSYPSITVIVAQNSKDFYIEPCSLNGAIFIVR
jgi:hypothetical protein